MRTINIKAASDNTGKVTDFINEQLEEMLCPMKTQMQIDVAVEEIFTNIVNYAYDGQVGDVEISVDMPEDGRTVVITFKDWGQEYNPLMREDPDISLSADERPIGGLGILLVKKLMDDVTYQFNKNCNILKLKKAI